MGEAAALIAALTWSCTSVAMASLSARVTPVAMSALRLLVATLLVPIAVVAAGQVDDLREASATAIFALVGSGILAYAIGDTIYIAALKQLGVQRAFTITMTLFIFLSVAGGVVLLDEEFHWYQVAGSAFIGAGILAIVRARSGAPEPAGPDQVVVADARPTARERRTLGAAISTAWRFVPIPARAMATAGAPSAIAVPARRVAAPSHRQGIGVQGYVMVVLVGVTWAAATLWLAKGRGDMPSIAASALRTPAGALGMLAFAMATAPADLAAPFKRPRDLAAIAALGLVGTAFGSLLYVYAVGEAGPGKTTVLSAASPLMALPLSVFFLKEKLTKTIAVGTAVAVVGVVLVVL